MGSRCEADFKDHSRALLYATKQHGIIVPLVPALEDRPATS
jgi:hypothetical protein